jgi:DNA polymerase-1
MPTRTLVKDLSQLPDLSAHMRLCFDLETTSFDDEKPALDPWAGCRMAGFAVATVEGDCWYLPLRHHAAAETYELVGDQREVRFLDGRQPNLPLGPAVAWIKALFEDPKREMFGHNVKFDLRFVRHEGIRVECAVADTMVLARLVDNTLFRLNLDFLSEKYGLGRKTKDEVGAYLRSVKSEDFGRVPPRIMAPYAMQDVALTWALRKRLQRDLPDFSVDLWKTEKAFTKVLHDAEFSGVRIDVKTLLSDYLSVLERQQDIVSALSRIVGWEVDPGKRTDKDRLFRFLGVKPTQFTETGQAKWTKAVLENIAIPDSAGPEAKEAGHLVRGYQYLSHFASTYMEGWLERRDPDGYLHADVRQAGTATGRLSASNPNIQNIPVEAERYIIPPDGDVIVGFDASQVEYRVFADYTGDETITRAYIEDPDADFHQYLADQLGVPRQFAKTTNFSMIYGMGKEKLLTVLMAMMAVTQDKERMEEKLRTMVYVSGLAAVENAAAFIKDDKGLRALAEKIYDEYHRKFPSIRKFAKGVGTVARERGWVRNKYGRRYIFDDARYESMAQRRAFGPHKAVNYLIQGSCADLLRRKLVECDPVCAAYGARLFMTVHDSVFWYVPRERAPEFFVEVKRVLEDCPEIKVPIRWEGKVSTRNVAADVEIDESHGTERGAHIDEKGGTTSWATGGGAPTVDDIFSALACADSAKEHGKSALEASLAYRVGRHGV